MQQCPNCGYVYDESEYASCPNCHPEDGGNDGHIVYDDSIGQAVTLYGSDYEDFKATHPGYH